MILAGDIGGTKTVLGLFAADSGGRLQQIAERTFASDAYGSLEAILAEFRAAVPETAPQIVCLGVAGPVIDGSCRTTNLPWSLEEQCLARALAVPHVKLLNDLEATAFGTRHLEAGDLVRLDESGIHRDGNVALVAAGTGLGEAMLHWDGKGYHPVASEGGHVDFAPRTEQEIAMLRYLWSVLGGHASYERLVSGPGLQLIYRFLRQGAPVEPEWLKQEMLGQDPSVVIARAGLSQEDQTCSEALDMFCSIYGAEAGNLALKCVATGGVFVGGGIAPKILPALRRGGFMAAFRDKGRFEPLLRDIEVNVILNPRTALLGAAHFAHRHCCP